MPRTRLFIALIFVSLGGQFVRGVCYYPDGSTSPQDTACYNNNETSTCCGQGYACLSNNICMSTGDETQKAGATSFVRGSCTDKTWRSNNCPLFCINPTDDLMSGGMGVAKCPNTDLDEYYCIDSEESLTNCTSETNVIIFQGVPSIITTIGVTATTTSTSISPTSTSTSTSATLTSSTPFSAAASSAPTSTSTSAPASSPSGSHTVAIAAGIAAPLVIIIAALIVFIVFRYRKSKNGSGASALQVPQDQPQLYHRRSHPPSYYRTEYKPELPASELAYNATSHYPTPRYELPDSMSLGSR